MSGFVSPSRTSAAARPADPRPRTLPRRRGVWGLRSPAPRVACHSSHLARMGEREMVWQAKHLSQCPAQSKQLQTMSVAFAVGVLTIILALGCCIRLYGTQHRIQMTCPLWINCNGWESACCGLSLATNPSMCHTSWVCLKNLFPRHFHQLDMK